MKKLIVLITFILLFSVALFTLVSCDDAKDDSSAQSEVSDESEGSKEDSDVESETSDDEEEEEEEEDIFVYDVDREKDRVNVAEGKGYEIILGEIGEDYPDEDGTTLTDGEVPELPGGNYSDGMWVGIKDVPTSEIIIDLGEAVEGVADFDAYLFYYSGAGIGVPTSMKVSVSEDGDKFYDVDTLSLSADDVELAEDADQGSFKASIQLEKGVKAQYVKFEFQLQTWLFVSELEVAIYE